MLSRFLPPAASAHAGAIDAMLEHVHLMVLVLFAGWAAYFIYVLLRFRSGAHPKASPAGTSGRFAMAVFAAVAVAEGVMLIGFALPLWFERTSAAPAVENPLIIRVTAEQFVWNVHYPGADREFGDTSPALVSPVARPIVGSDEEMTPLRCAQNSSYRLYSWLYPTMAFR